MGPLTATACESKERPVGQLIIVVSSIINAADRTLHSGNAHTKGIEDNTTINILMTHCLLTTWRIAPRFLMNSLTIRSLRSAIILLRISGDVVAYRSIPSVGSY
mmetsp:Transcript_15112/g.33726  ORF Transcript_15112/g.33726 Transcript_15112/m.33726 type:complete len:104 (-) Transcript_15112:3150-3461(-)